MGIYHADISNSKAIVLRHEGEDDHSIEIHEGATGASGSGAYAAVPQFFQNQVEQGKRYIISISFSEVKEAPPAAAEPETVPAPSKSAAKPKKASKAEGIAHKVEDKIEHAAKTVKKTVKVAAKKASAKKS